MSAQGFDWGGLMRVGFEVLRLDPEVFWRLTPFELRVMLGAREVMPRLSRAQLKALEAAFPDVTVKPQKEEANVAKPTSE